MINFFIEHWFATLVVIGYFTFIGWFTWLIHKPDKHDKKKE